MDIIPTKFALNGVTNDALNFYVLDGWSRPMSPATEDRTAKVLGRAGNIWIDSNLSARSFSIPGYFITESPGDIDGCARNLAALLVDARGRPRTLKLIFVDEPALYYTVRYNAEIGLVRYNDQMRGTFAIPLIADDPYAYAVNETVTTEAGITASGHTWTFESATKISTPAKICITNDGASAVNGITITLEYQEDV